jgi:hypothetical protein
MRTALLFLSLCAASAGAADLTPTAVVEAPAYVAPQMPVHVVTEVEAEVYAAFLTQAWAKSSDDSAPLARQSILLENDSVDAWQPGRRAWEQYLLKRTGGQGRASDDAEDAFLKRPVQIVRFYAFPVLEVPIRLLRSDVLAETLRTKGWDGFYEAYPKTQGILSLSSVAFGARGLEALFSARLQCGKRCGYRDLVLMRKVNGVWTLIMKDALP